MSDFTNGSQSGSTSHDCVDIYYDGPGDTSVRPLTGKLLELAKAQRALIEETKRHQSANVQGPREVDANGV